MAKKGHGSGFSDDGAGAPPTGPAAAVQEFVAPRIHQKEASQASTRPPETGDPRRRAAGEKQNARRAAILVAALDEFSTQGFAATRIDDIARRAGVAKGTVYLYFRDKEALFQDLVRTMLVPLVAALEAEPPSDLSVRDILERFFTTFAREVHGTRRAAVLRLILAEGPRFPALAEFYYRNVVERGIAAMRALMGAALARGDIENRDLAAFPHLIVAPAIISIVWSDLFDRFAPLKVEELMRAHLDLLFGPRRTP